jgi:hypothetical protein
MGNFDVSQILLLGGDVAGRKVERVVSALCATGTCMIDANKRS